ncbi:hypothetical protein [Clostridium weizhouense]|uniref:Lipoprotein n=1 Tax=Clostridium weizhouense TaxID=2859781 RepID=A0ABS7AJS1_9CLOT|nr:hypothetical protein [Clostridium weizhouense]MBW6408882.1 hypothetical protein [Clostridium weizhouense]
MRKVITYVFMGFAIIMNAYLIFYWNPKDYGYKIDKLDNDCISVMSYSKSIYTKNKDTIEKNLCDEDKKDLNRIILKLSTADIGRIKECLKIKDDTKSVVEVFKILSTRLSSNDYLRIREICSNFIDLKYLDENLTK